MSASPAPATAPSQKRPLEEPSSPNGPTDQPDAKRPALDKAKDSTNVQEAAPASPTEAKVQVDAAEPAVESATANNEEPTDSHGDTVVLDAPPAGMPSATQVLETQPVQSSAANGLPSGAQDQYSAQQQDESNWLHVRAIISSAEAATVIGKGGENVTQIRRMSGAKCTVSDYSRGAVERVLTVSGLVDAVAKVMLSLNHRLISQD